VHGNTTVRWPVSLLAGTMVNGYNAPQAVAANSVGFLTQWVHAIAIATPALNQFCCSVLIRHSNELHRACLQRDATA
jgi:hypothetical protein